MTADWTLRRCGTCGVLETDPTAMFVFDQGCEEVVHVVNGMLRCGVLVVVDEVTS